MVSTKFFMKMESLEFMENLKRVNLLENGKFIEKDKKIENKNR